MTDTETVADLGPAGTHAAPLRRAIAGELELRETEEAQPEVVGRIIPFGVTQEVVDPTPDGRLARYRERFVPGCTTHVRQEAARRRGGPTWVILKLGHVETFDEQVGFARAIEERDDGVWATFQLWRHARLDKIRDMLRTSHTGLSVEFYDRRPTVEEGVQVRRSIFLRGVAATPVPQYADAGIVAVRGDVEVDLGTPNLDRVEAMLAELNAASGAR